MLGNTKGITLSDETVNLRHCGYPQWKFLRFGEKFWQSKQWKTKDLVVWAKNFFFKFPDTFLNKTETKRIKIWVYMVFPKPNASKSFWNSYEPDILVFLSTVGGYNCKILAERGLRLQYFRWKLVWNTHPSDLFMRLFFAYGWVVLNPTRISL